MGLTRIAARWAVCLLVVAAAGWPSSGRAQSAGNLYEHYSAEQRRAIQEGLAWTGHYEGVVDGRIGPGTLRAIRAYQRENGKRPTGILGRGELDALLRHAERRKQAVGFVAHHDPESGVAMELPLALAPPVGRIEHGTRFASPDERLQIELFRLGRAEGSFREMYRRVQSDRPDRRVTYSRFGNDWFVVSGIEGQRQFYMRARREGDEAAAFVVVYDEGMEPTVEPMIIAMSNSFADPPLAATRLAQAPAAPQARPGEEPTSAPPAPEPAPGEMLQPGARGVPPVAAGFAVAADGHFLTTARIAECDAPSVGDFGPASIVAVDQRNDLALLKVGSETVELAVGFGVEPLSVGQKIFAAAPAANPDSAAYVSIGRIMALSAPDGDTSRIAVSAPPRVDDGGAPLLGEGGQVIGILVGMAAPAVAEATVNPRSGGRVAIRREVAQMFLSAHGIASGGAVEEAPPDAEAGADLAEPDPAELARTVTQPVFCEDAPAGPPGRPSRR